jgi:hypothetical protein
LYSGDYAGFTYKWELKYLAGGALICWEYAGVNALTEAATARDSFKKKTILCRCSRRQRLVKLR